MNLTVIKLCPICKQTGETKAKKLSTPGREISPFNTSGTAEMWGAKAVPRHGQPSCTRVHEEQRAQSKRGASSPGSSVGLDALGGVLCLPAAHLFPEDEQSLLIHDTLFSPRMSCHFGCGGHFSSAKALDGSGMDHKSLVDAPIFF